MHSKITYTAVKSVLGAILVSCTIGWSSAGAQEPMMINVMRIQLKPAMNERFRALHLTQTMPNQRAAGLPWRLTTANFFGNNFEVMIATPLQNFAELDNRTFVPTEIGQALFSESVDHRERLVVQTRPDLSIPGDGTKDLRRMAYFQVRQGRIPEFEQFWTNTVLPAMRNRGITGYQVFQTVIGGPQGQYVGGLWLDNFAAMDGLDMGTLLSAAQQREFGDLVESYTIELQEVDRELSWGLPGM